MHQLHPLSKLGGMPVSGGGASAETQLQLYYGFETTAPAMDSEMIKEFDSPGVTKSISAPPLCFSAAPDLASSKANGRKAGKGHKLASSEEKNTEMRN